MNEETTSISEMLGNAQYVDCFNEKSLAKPFEA